MKSFSLVEVLIVIAILVALSAMLVPLGFNYYKSQQLDASTKEILQTLRRAQSKAMALEMDSQYGVRIENNNYILFKTDTSYAGRDTDYDEIINVPDFITISDQPKEVIFSKYEGTPNSATEIVLSNGLQARKIIVNAFGTISLFRPSPYVTQVSYRFRNDDGGE